MKQRLDSEATARVLRRAHEIEDEHHDDAVEAGGVSPRALIEAADDVGIDPDAVRDALAIERFDSSAPQSRRLDRLVGPAAVVVEHVVHRDAAQVVGDVEQWLATVHRMRCVTSRDGIVECRPRSGLGASIGRTLTSFTSDVNIRAVERVTVDAEALHMGATPDRPRTLVRLTADRKQSRARRLGGGSTVGLAGAGVAAAVAAGSAPILAVVSAGLLGGGYVVARSGSSNSDKVELELMRVLTAVDRGEQPAGLVGRAARRASAVVRETVSARATRREGRPDQLTTR